LIGKKTSKKEINTVSFGRLGIAEASSRQKCLSSLPTSVLYKLSRNYVSKIRSLADSVERYYVEHVNYSGGLVDFEENTETFAERTKKLKYSLTASVFA